MSSAPYKTTARKSTGGRKPSTQGGSSRLIPEVVITTVSKPATITRYGRIIKRSPRYLRVPTGQNHASNVHKVTPVREGISTEISAKMPVTGVIDIEMKNEEDEDEEVEDEEEKVSQVDDRWDTVSL